jgi:hypothetical protein
MKDLDTQFLCKDCSRYNLCKYYDRRKRDSYICKYFHLTETFGMTNGEVIQALFPNISVYEHGSTYSVNNEYNFNSTWWNAPYQKGGEE